MQRRGNAVVIVIVALAVILLIVGSIMPFILLATFLGPNIDKPTGSFGGNGCFLTDSAFSDTSISANPSEVIATLKKDSYRLSQINKMRSETPDAKEFDYYINSILERGKNEGINPAIVIAIWWGEQEFKHPEKAFGYKHYDSGASSDVLSGSTEERWQKQLEGVYKTVRRAMQGEDMYASPAGTNINTRLFYNYATAMRTQYDESGKRWEESYKHPSYGNPYYKRLNIVRLLVENQVQCESSGGAGVATGDYACVAEESAARNAGRGGWGDVASKRTYKTGTYAGHEGYDLMAPVGTRVFSASDGEVVKVSVDNDGDGESSTSVTVREANNIFWYYTHLQRPSVREGQQVKKGDKLAEVGVYVRNSNGEQAHHLHVGISKRLDNRPTLGGTYNWDAWYYPYEFLRHIPCLQPPAATEVNYP
jgi:murein DD-endopeptidase MepM/ murein hydrolase activator NlpD